MAAKLSILHPYLTSATDWALDPTFGGTPAWRAAKRVYADSAAWDAGAWQATGDKSVLTSVGGHRDTSGAATVSGDENLSVVHVKDWSTEHVSARHRDADSTVWTTTKDDTTYRTSADDSFDTVITDRPYGITSGLPLHGPVGTSQQTHHVENTNTYAFGHTLGVDGTYHPFGSGSATNVDQTEIDYAGARETPILRDESVSDSYLGTYTDRLTGELSYHEHGHKRDAASVTTDWTLDASGGWRAAQTDRIESGSGEAFSDYVETEHYLYEDAYPENTIISDTTQTGSVHWGNDYTNHLTVTTDAGGVLSASGTGERHGYGQGTVDLDVIDSRGYSYHSQDAYDLSVNAPQTFSLTGVTPDQPLPITNHQTGSYQQDGPDGPDSNSYDTTVSQNGFSPDAYNLGYYGDSYYGSDVPNPFGVSIDTGYHRNGQTLPSTPTGTPPTPSIPPSGNPNAPAKPTVELPTSQPTPAPVVQPPVSPAPNWVSQEFMLVNHQALIAAGFSKNFAWYDIEHQGQIPWVPNLVDQLKAVGIDANRLKMGIFNVNGRVYTMYTDGVNTVYSTDVASAEIGLFSGVLLKSTQRIFFQTPQAIGNFEKVSPVLVSGAMAGLVVSQMAVGFTSNLSGAISRATVPTPINLSNVPVTTANGNTSTLPRNLREQLAAEETAWNPAAGKQVPVEMTDSRWPQSDGWVKMQQTLKPGGQPITLHYVYNEITHAVDDLKIMLAPN